MKSYNHTPKETLKLLFVSLALGRATLKSIQEDEDIQSWEKKNQVNVFLLINASYIFLKRSSISSLHSIQDIYFIVAVIVVWSLSHVCLFVTPGTAARQASLSFTIF